MRTMVPVTEIPVSTDISIEKMKSNILDSKGYGLRPITELFGEPKEDAIAIVGGGPSLYSTIPYLPEYDTIMVCGSAHDYLYSQGILATYSIICDPDPIMANYLRKWDERITYLIASQCDQEVFSLLSLAPKKYIWDCSAGEMDRELFDSPEKLIIGGCTVGTRAIGMAIAMGHKKIDLFGFDTCLTNTYKHHAYEFNDPEQETLGNITEIRLDDPEKGKKFICAGYMVAQILDFQWMLKNFADKLDIKIFGGGALAYIMERGKAKATQLIKEQRNVSRS